MQGSLIRWITIALAITTLACTTLSTAQAQDELTAEQEARLQALRGHLEQSVPQARIPGGTPVPSIDDYPWMASIGFERSNGSIFSFCGGSLIAPDWIVTAAHCKVQPGDKVILGRLRLSTDAGVVHDVAESISHPDYNPSTNDSDIALLRLVTSSDQDTIALIGADELGANPEADYTITGWGLLEEGGEASDVLMEVTVPILSNPVCAFHYGDAGVGITANMLCAAEDGKDSCQGDSGGPGMISDPNLGDFRLAGVVSFGIGCARPDFPGVYTRVSNFLTWIKDHTGVEPPPEGCPPCN